MNVEQKNLPQSEIELIITMTDEEIKPHRAAAVKKIGEQVKIDGFRKGQVPEQMLIQQFGEAVIMEEACNIMLPKVIAKACEKAGQYPIAQPKVDIQEVSPITFSVVFPVAPKVTLPKKWQDSKVKAQVVKVTTKEEQEVMENLRKRMMERKVVERKAKKDDWVEIDFAGKDKDGVPLEGAQSKAHPLIIGLDTFIPGFEDELIGLKAGDEKSFEITFPQDYHAKHLAGKPVTFEITMHSVQEQILPEVTDEFAEKIFGKKMTVKQMEEEITKLLTEKAEDEERQRQENELIEGWVKGTTVEIPQVMINAEVQRMLEAVKQHLAPTGQSWQQHLDAIGKTDEQIMTEMATEATKKVTARLAVQQIMQELGDDLKTDQKAVADHAHAMFHQMNSHHHGEEHDHPEIAPGTQLWEQAENEMKVKALFDYFLK